MKIFNNQNLKRDSLSDPFAIQEGRVKNGKLGDTYRLGWTEEVFTTGKIERKTLGLSFDFTRLYLVVFVLFFLLSAIIARVAWLQVVKGEYYYSMAEGNRIRVSRIEAKRGIIYDSQHRALVHNAANFLLYVIPSDLPTDKVMLDSIVNRLSQILGNKSKEEIGAIIETVKPKSLEAYNPLFIADNIDYNKAMLLYLESERMPGVVLSNRTRRNYNLYASSLSHILGYTGKINDKELKKNNSEEYLPIDYIGKSGIESFWENELKGLGGKKYIEVDALGKEKKIISEEKPQDGHNLVLSIDTDSQKKLEELMLSTLDGLKMKKGSAIVMDPNNGEIIAIVSLPSFDTNLFAKGISSEDYKKLTSDPDNPLFSRAVSGEFPSGSVIKPVISAAALNEGVITESTTFLSNGGLRIGQWFFPDWKAGGHGVTDVKKAIAQSVNTFYYIIGGGYQDFVGLGPDRIAKYEKMFGIGSQLGIDLPAEGTGFVPTKEWKEKTTGEKWYIGNTYHISIGQGDTLVTPLQVANFTAYFANGGKMYRPHIVKEILTSDDKPYSKIETDPVKENLVDSEYVRIVRDGMRQTITSGSASSMKTLPVEAAGKTGTAQWSTKKLPHAWFTGFAPFDNPKIVITVLLEGAGEGSHVAVPIARDFMQWYFGGKPMATSTPSGMATTTAITTQDVRR